jgi:hypothetical protein
MPPFALRFFLLAACLSVAQSSFAATAGEHGQLPKQEMPCFSLIGDASEQFQWALQASTMTWVAASPVTRARKATPCVNGFCQ